jgi:hypothetical protein
MESEDKLEEWIEKSLCFRWLHRNSWYYYSQMDVIFSYLIISIGIFNALTTFVCNNYFSLNNKAKNTETFILSSSSLAISGIAQLHRKAKFYEKSQQHIQASKIFENYNRKLRTESMLQLEESSLREIIQEYDEIANSQPEIPHYVIKKFRKKYGDLPIWKPNILYDLRDLKKRKETHITENPVELKAYFYAWVFATTNKKKHLILNI